MDEYMVWYGRSRQAVSTWDLVDVVCVYVSVY